MLSSALVRRNSRLCIIMAQLPQFVMIAQHRYCVPVAKPRQFAPWTSSAAVTLCCHMAQHCDPCILGAGVTLRHPDKTCRMLQIILIASRSHTRYYHELYIPTEDNYTFSKIAANPSLWQTKPYHPQPKTSTRI